MYKSQSENKTLLQEEFYKRDITIIGKIYIRLLFEDLIVEEN